MAAPTLYRTAGNEFSTTLSASCTDTDLTMSLNSATGLNTAGTLIIDEGVAGKEEVIAYTNVAGTVLTIPSGGRGLSGTTAYSHSSGATVTDIIVDEHFTKMYNSFTAEHSEAGVHSSATVTSLKASTAEIETGTSDVKVITPLGLASSEYGQVYNSMSRQAVMNGNFDIWQRGTSVALADVTVAFQADRWRDYVDKNGGTLPTLTRSRQLLTSGDIPNAYYFTRLATDGAGTSLGVSSQGYLSQRIENGTRNLCGASKTVTVSFYARSSITNKRITPTIFQNYGTGGSPTSVEVILGTPITLTSSWVKYTATFTTNTLVGKTFGTNNDDYLGLYLWYQWGTTSGNSYVQAGVSAETYVGSGNIDIAQVQLCSGDVALPFQPKTFEEELRACQRYYETSFPYGTTPADGTNPPVYLWGFWYSTTSLRAGPTFFKVPKRTTPTIVYYGVTGGTAGKWSYLTSGGINNASATTDDYVNTVGLSVQNTTGVSTLGAGALVSGNWTASAEL